MSSSNWRSFFSRAFVAQLFILFMAGCGSDKPYSAEGTVEQIENGKDGYTALLKSADGKYFDAVISRVKLQQDYILVKSGDRITVTGDTIHLENKVRVMAKSIKVY